MSDKLSFFENTYKTQSVSVLANKYKIVNPHCMPKIEKVVVSMRLGKDATDKKALDHAMEELGLITGQKPNYSKAKKSISGFKLREGQIIGAYVTLRRKKMYEFLERLVYIALPRIRDFKGYKVASFDDKLNFNFGIKEHLVFRELSYDKIYKSRGLDISINMTNVASQEMAVDLLKLFNFPIK